MPSQILIPDSISCTDSATKSHSPQHQILPTSLFLKVAAAKNILGFSYSIASIAECILRLHVRRHLLFLSLFC